MSDQERIIKVPASQLYFSLRDDLFFTLHHERGDSYYVGEDRARSKFFRLGVPEHQFLSQLNGSTSLADALGRAKELTEPHAELTEEQAMMLVRWAIEAGLMKKPRRSDDLSPRPSPDKSKFALSQLLVTRLPLIAPDRFLSRVTPALTWLFSRWAVAAWCLLMLVSVNVLGRHWVQFQDDARGVFYVNNWLWIATCWLVLKVLHELAHGVVCKKYGGNVREAGCILILFMPVAYIDVTSSWRFRSKWQRIYTAAAGIYLELALAALAVLLWAQLDPGPVRATCVNLIVMASVTTVLFNANPLMRFDGYYVLTDLLHLPNLNELGRRYLRSFGAMLFLGRKTPTRLPVHRGKAWFVRIYAVCSLAWRLLVTTSLILLAGTMFRGAGIVLAAIGVVAWFGVPLWQFARSLFASHSMHRPNFVRLCVVTLAVASGCATFFVWIPTPFGSSSPGVVQFAPLVRIRPESDGFVEAVYVKTGDYVDADQLIAVLQNEALVRELRELEIDEQLLELSCRGHKSRGEIGSYQAALKELDSVRERLNTRRWQVDSLQIKAPSAGFVVTRNLDALVGTYIKSGTVLLSLGDEIRKEVRVSISQAELPQLQRHLGQRIHLYTSDGQRVSGQLSVIEPRASKQPLDLSLCVSHGGSLSVQVVSREANDMAGGETQFRHFAPRFTVIIQLDPVTSQQLAAGRRCHVSVGRTDETLGETVWNSLSSWLRKRVQGSTTPDA